ncbi:MAG: 4Fe-4S dicluster domain-containing protein [Verrucomicrobiota bacterium]
MDTQSDASNNLAAPSVNRRGFLRASAVFGTGAAALVASLKPLLELKDFTSMEQFLQKYYKEMTPEDMQKVLTRIENEVERQYGVRPNVRDLKPMNGVEYVYALNLTRCIGCRKCVHACVAENNQSRSPEIQYIRVLKMPHGSLDVEKSDHDYNPEKVPEKGFFYMPVQCQQCKNPPCVKVCPVHATWQDADGITVIDYLGVRVAMLHGIPADGRADSARAVVPCQRRLRCRQWAGPAHTSGRFPFLNATPGWS